MMPASAPRLAFAGVEERSFGDAGALLAGLPGDAEARAEVCHLGINAGIADHALEPRRIDDDGRAPHRHTVMAHHASAKGSRLANRSLIEFKPDELPGHALGGDPAQGLLADEIDRL